MSQSKTIAKNTIFLYFRMMILMLVSLYTSRVILKALGVDDYGIYQAVGGIVGFMYFLNAALATSSSRFITFAIGEGNKEKTRETFSTVFIVHFCLAIFIIIVGETLGLWFFYNKMVIPPERQFAAMWVFHISIATAAINITQIPYSGCITAHEHFSLYAYASIVEAFLQLGVAYALMLVGYDKLIFYAIALFVLKTGLRLFYRWYCNKYFEECKVKWKFEKSIIGPIAKFSGWSLFANITIALNNQGVLLLLNMFFSPAIVASRALSLQVDGVIKLFVSNFLAASNPQIIKSYASGNKNGSKNLLLQASIFSFYLMLVLCVPVCITAEPLLKIWLDVVPDYAVLFLQLLVIQNLFGVFDLCYFRAFSAAGRLKENALVSPAINLIRFIVIYLLFKKGFDPLALSYAGIIAVFIIGLVAKPYLMIRYLDYHWRDFTMVYIPCLRVAVPTVIIASWLYIYLYPVITHDILKVLVVGGSSVIVTITLIWLFGLNQQMRLKLIGMVRGKL